MLGLLQRVRSNIATVHSAKGSLFRLQCDSLIGLRASVAYFHTTPPTLTTTTTEPTDTYNAVPAPDKRPALHALAARLGVQSISEQVLQQIVTHPSAKEKKNNATYEYIGKRVLGLCSTEYVHCRYPNLDRVSFARVIGSYVSSKSLFHIARQVGFQDSIVWSATLEEKKVKRQHVMSSAVYALLGALYEKEGFDVTKKFIHGHILARELDIRPSVMIKEPKRHLTLLMKNLGRPVPVSRLLSETGRESNSPVFIVGIFSDEEKLAEGHGSSKKMAEHRAIQGALFTYYGKETKDFVLPSDAHTVASYTPPTLATIKTIT
ncbi:ribonuclease III domain-containing protein [Spinellus fusiger]|nr:ribonuclease III domain-containing protein [Spinellus fusiger]